METLFRFVLARPPVAQDEDTPSIDLAQATDFQLRIVKAAAGRGARERVHGLTSEFARSAAYLADPADLPVADRLAALGSRLSTLAREKVVTPGDLGEAVRDAFDATPAELVARGVLDQPLERLRDSILTIKYQPDEHHRDVEGLTQQLRLIELVHYAAEHQEFPGTGEALALHLRRTVKLPDLAALESALSTKSEREEAEAERDKLQKQRTERFEALRAELVSVRQATKELADIDTGGYEVTRQEHHKGFMVKEELRPLRVFELEMTKRQQDLDRLSDREREFGEERLPLRRLRDPLSSIKETGLSTAAAAPRGFLETGTPPFVPEASLDKAFRISGAAYESLTGATRSTLKTLGLDVLQLPLDHAVHRLEDRSRSLVDELDRLIEPPRQQAIKRIGDTFVSISTPIGIDVDAVLGGYPFPSTARVPTTHGSVAPAGVADLLVVKQQLIGYEGADVAHIENVLKGEHKEREHIRRQETEQLTFTEVEVTTSEERELESTNRFEMSRESEKTIKEDASLKAGLNVSAKYGPFVEVSASVEGSTSRSKEEASKSASTFSQDVTERSSRKVAERVLQRSSLKVTNEVTETNTHGIDNRTGEGHIAGVYQWVNKVYQAQIFNYGLRTLYDFMVPEPAAYLIRSMLRAGAKAVEVEKPLAFTLRPDQLSVTNYHTYVARYGATDVDPPPELYTTESFDFHAGGGDDKTDYHHSGQLSIADGYEAVWTRVAAGWNQWESSASIGILVGGRHVKLAPGGSSVWTGSLDNQRGSVPYGIETFKMSQVAVTGEVKCRRTERALTRWQLQTHAKITNAYQARVADYEEKLAALQMQAGVAIEGQNPEANIELMRDELRKHCLSILTDQHFDLFNAIQHGSTGMPQINLHENEAEGPYVRFFEQAFEWEHLTWITYPYFWGRKAQWEARVAYEDPDPVFNQFLKAGYCRVVVPARLGFEGAIDHFRLTGDVWTGGPLPTISDPLYLPIAEEIAQRLDRPGEELPQGDPWKVRIPTTLVHLRADDELPRWTQAPDGEWVEEA